MKSNSHFSIPKSFVAAFCLICFSLVTLCSADIAEEQQSECLNCHRFRNINSNEGVISSQKFCYNCHQNPGQHADFRASKVSLQVKPEFFRDSPHKFAACIQCHITVARSPHKSISGVNCSGCHYRINGSPGTHAEHTRVRCEACHTDSPYVKLDAARNQVLLARLNEKQEPISLAQHKLTDVSRDEFCKRCHVSSNTVGAPDMVLPSKSFVCIACHYSPLKIGSPFFLIAVIIGILGIVGILGFWFKAGVQNEVSSVHRKIQLGSEVVWSKIFSREIVSVLKTIVFDIFLQRRILANGVSRWLIHSLIFYSFFARFALSFYTLLSHKISPKGDWTLTLVDRDSSFVATFSDVTGVFILIGVIWALVRRFVTKPEYVLTEEQDTVALLMIGLVTFSGFLLEAMRMLVTQIPSEIAVSAFAGYVLSLLLSVFNLNWQSIYGYMWYIHALLWAVFIAYIPFGKLKHILTTPLSLLLNYKKA